MWAKPPTIVDNYFTYSLSYNMRITLMVVANAQSPASLWEVRRRVWINSSATGNDVPYQLHRNNTFHQSSRLWRVWFLVLTLLIRKIHYFKARGTETPQGPRCHASRQPHRHHVRGQEQSWWSTSPESWPKAFCLLTSAVQQVACLLPARSPVISFALGNPFFGCYWGFAWLLTVVQPTIAALFSPCIRRRGCVQYLWPTRNSQPTWPR